jgi:putative ABC transport system substrate-binding protein
MMSSTDPVGTRLVASLAQPGGNVTGLTSITSDLGGKALELLKESMPALARVIAPYPAGGISQNLFFRETDVSARALGVKLMPMPVRGSQAIADMFRTATRERAERSSQSAAAHHTSGRA